VCWCGADQRETDCSSPEKRRVLAAQYVKEGILKGYLAYHKGKAVGWCNANTKVDCLQSGGWQWFMKSLHNIEDEPGSKVKSIFCFVIAPEMQRKGIASTLLERACKDAADEGFDYVEAYPKKSFTDVSSDFKGPAGMYKKQGFVLHKEFESGNVETVMRKKLK
jgi:GNAT superfamily N-acetyltransferase